MNSPNLLASQDQLLPIVDDAWCHACYRVNRQHLLDLDRDPLPLQAWLAQQRQQRLGVYFESLLGFWLKQILQAEIYHHNIPVFEHPEEGYGRQTRGRQTRGRQTIGEFDFLFRLPGERVLRHWEAAVKFYLRFDNGAQVLWYGPAARDRLDIKLDHLLHHQLALAHTAAGERLIDSLNLDRPLSAAFVKGYLFHPYASWQNTYYEPGLSALHLRGWWLRLSEFNTVCCANKSLWKILDKRQWLSPARLNLEQADILLTGTDILSTCRRYIDQHSRPLLIVEFQLNDENWVEVSRGFVVDEAWPLGPRYLDM